jgi:DNA-directed RNA polymerase specialized sigma subunit
MTKKLIQEWIKEDQMRVYPLQIEVEQIEMALQALTKSEYFILECKYFDSMTWIEIEMSYNNTYNTNITEIRLKQISSNALQKINNILSNFYINAI